MHERIRDAIAALIAIASLVVALAGWVQNESAAPPIDAFGPDPTLPGLTGLLVGVGVFLGCAIWVGRGEAGERLRAVAVPLSTAVSAPLVLYPAVSSRPSDEGPGATILVVLAFLVLADGLAAGLDRRARVLAAVVAASGAVLAVLVEPPIRIGGLPDDLAAAVRWAAGLAILVPPVVLTLRGSRTGAAAAAVDRPAWEAGVDEIPLVIAALTPPATLLAWGLDRGSQSLALSLIWLTIAVAILGTRTRVRTFRLQRDLVVTATEAERRRLAADLHDDALQEMAVLVRRLDSAGFSEAAETARAIAERLREVCGELRLPILDDLGAGSAIAWLVDRVERASIDRIELERSESGRPPPPVELAVFRVAQEALSNAVTHGGGPITVRYAAGPDLVHLSVLDSGSGLTREAAVAARRSGHFGLLTMRQRAEQIGASLEIRGGPEGGTQVALEWRST